MKSINITTAIFYANSLPHIGSIYEVIFAHTVSKIFKIFDYDVFFSTGMDEYGNKVEKSALNTGQTAKEWVDLKTKEFQSIFKIYGISWDRFIRTTDKDHKKAVFSMWEACKEYIYLDIYDGYYSEKEERFYTKEHITIGANKKIIGPAGDELTFLSENCFFFRISAFEQEIKDFLEKDIVIPDKKKNELFGFIKNGLKDLCISRERVTWGIPVPNGIGTIYVWFDALTNYLTTCGYPNLDEKWNNTYHIIGKDIITFHGIYWPIMLMAAKIKPFQKLVVHNWWLCNQEKMSKSTGNIVDPKLLADKYPIDCIKFYLLYSPILNKDCDFDEEKMVEIYNNILVAKFSNLVHRVHSLLDKNNLVITNYRLDKELHDELHEYIKNFDIQGYIHKLLVVCDELNKEVEDKEIWKNINDASKIFEKILMVIDFFRPVFNLEKFDPRKPSPLFQKII